MTISREEAIERLKTLGSRITTVKMIYYIDRDILALNMGISALETDPQKILKDISSEFEKMIKEHEGLDPYEMGVSVGLSMARVEISNRRLDLEGIPR